MKISYIGLGSNVGDRVSYLYKALKAIDADPDMSVRACSSIYETDPYGPVKQQDFLNLTAKISTNYSPVALLEKLQAIETKLDRTREIYWGPRTIDLDILLYNHENIEMEQLKVPHPELTKRAFVLIPLNELAPDATLPDSEQIRSVAAPFLNDPGVRLWKAQSDNKDFGLF